MFNLGIKQIIINSDAVVVETAGAAGEPAAKVVIDGFGTFYTSPTGADAGGFVTAGSEAVLGEYPFATIAGAAAGDIFDIRVYVGGTDRVIGEIWPYNSNSFIFQILWDTDLITSLQAAQVAGLNDKILKFVAPTAGSEAQAALFQAGYQGLTVEKVTYVKSDATVVTAAAQRETALAIDAANVIAGSEGVNTGRILEATVRNSTYENTDPYGILFGGSTAVDVRGLYNEVHWVSTADHELGWEPHEMLGYGDANTTTNYAPRQYSAYCNNVSATAAQASLAKLAANTPDAV